MGNAADCNYCSNHGKTYSFGCPKCGRVDLRPEQEKKYDRFVPVDRPKYKNGEK